MNGVTADRAALLARMVQIYGSASSCARFCGITRQALNNRIASAGRWSNSHAWFALILAIETRIDGLTAEQMTSRAVPTVDQLNQIWALQDSVWKVAQTKRFSRRTEIKAAKGAA